MVRNHLVNRFNVYRDGTRMVGVAGELTLPEVTYLTDSLEGAGTGGNMDVPVIGLIEDIELEISFDSLCEDIFSLIGGTVDISIHGGLQGTDTGTGAAGFTEISIIARGIVKKFTPGTMKAGGKMGSSVALGLSYYKYAMGGKTELEIDRFNGVFVVSGKDLLSEVRNMC